MRLGVKIFFCVTIFFSLIFLFGGYQLLSGFYETELEREVKNAAEQYQYNKFVLQAMLLNKGDDWFRGMANGEYDAQPLAQEMNHTVALYAGDGGVLYSDFPEEIKVSGLLSGVGENTVSCRFYEAGGRYFVLAAGMVGGADAAVYVVTGIDATELIRQQEAMLAKFGMVYAGAIAAALILTCGLSVLLTRRVARLSGMAQEIASGNYSQRIPVGSGDEVGQLAELFNRMASAVEEKVHELSESAERNEDFVRNFAHELKTPLTSVIGYADRLYQKELPREEQRAAALTIWNEGMRLEALSHKLMELALLDQGQFVLQEMRADLLLQEFSRELACWLEEKGITLSCRVEEGEIHGDYDLLKSVFLNLVDNCAKAGATHIGITGAGKPDAASPGYEIAVSDNGTGIPPGEMARITEAFYMVDKSRSRKQHGAGIGLSLADRIVKLHGGRMWFEGNREKGTTVRVWLPSFPPLHELRNEV